MYSKISISRNHSLTSPIVFSANLTKDEEIKNIEVLDNNKLLILIKSNEMIKGLIYDSENNQIIRVIKR